MGAKASGSDAVGILCPRIGPEHLIANGLRRDALVDEHAPRLAHERQRAAHEDVRVQGNLQVRQIHQTLLSAPRCALHVLAQQM